MKLDKLELKDFRVELRIPTKDEIIGIDRKFEGKGEQWEENLRIAEIMLIEAGVKITKL